MTDVELWGKVIDGDMTALSLLYKDNYDLLLNWGLKFASDEEFVKDCIQDVFVKICSSRILSPTQYVRSYLLTSLRNMIYDKLSSARCTVELNDRLFEIDEDSCGIQRLFKNDDEALKRSHKLIVAYNSLTYNQRMGIYLKYVKGLSHKEIAAVMEMNPQSAMNLVSRALRSLRSTMGDKHFLLYLCIFLSISE